MSDDEADYSTPADMKRWLAEETAKVQLTANRRLKEAASFVEAYASGQLTPEEAEKRLSRYEDRWPDRIVLDRSVEREIDGEVNKLLAQRQSGNSDKLHR